VDQPPEPNAEVLAKQADVVFLALPHGVAAEFAIPLNQAGCIGHRSQRRLPPAQRGIYKERFYAHDHPAPELLRSPSTACRRSIATHPRRALIASPGCYPTSILLPTLPLLRAG
jgi:N-acetyl-gamma-glutamyl-phosphate reductase